MKKFVFSLEKVLKFKNQILDVKKNELSLLQAQLKELEKKIEELSKDYTQTNARLVEEMKHGLTPNDIAVYKVYLNDLDKKIKKFIQDKLQLLDIIAIKKKDIIVINSEISGLDRLKQKQLEIYRKLSQKEQELAIEEFVSQGHCSVV